MSPKIYKHTEQFVLESGEFLPQIEIAYTTYGQLNVDKSNVVWICHAFTANSDPAEWWPEMVGEGRVFDPSEHFIVCANILGSCYGTTGPLSINPETGKPWYRDFPFITVRDIVNAHLILANYLEINRIHTLTGGSVGGHQAIEWAIIEPNRFEHVILIATNARFSPWGIAFSASQRMAIEADPTFYNDQPNGGANGLKTARSIALISYRNAKAYNKTQPEDSDEVQKDFKADSYQRYQGEKLEKRFNAYSYYILSQVLDGHNVARGRKSLENALSQIKVPTLIVGIDSDLMFTIDEQEEMHKYIPNSTLKIISSDFGHDGFLIEYEKLTEHIIEFYNAFKQKDVFLNREALVGNS
jgi:homoserine O-acetyltransferase